MNITFKAKDGRSVEIGKLEGIPDLSRAPLPPLTPEEETYGRGLCLLPTGWEDLSGDERWLQHLSDELRCLWGGFTRAQKMAIASTVSEIADDLFNTMVEAAGY